MNKWPYFAWRLLYTGLLVWFAMFFFVDSRNEMGKEPGYYLLLFGALPSLLLIPLARFRPLFARRCAFIYGYSLLVSALLVAVVARGFLWCLAAFPLLGFPIEAVVLSLKRS